MRLLVAAVTAATLCAASWAQTLDPLPDAVARGAMCFESATFSPDGKALALVLRRTMADLGWPAFRVNVPMQPTMWLLREGRLESHPGMVWPRWSPRGTALAAIELGPRPGGTLVCRFRDGPFRRVADLTFADSYVAIGWLSEHELAVSVPLPRPPAVLRRSSGSVTYAPRTAIRVFDVVRRTSRELVTGTLWDFTTLPARRRLSFVETAGHDDARPAGEAPRRRLVVCDESGIRRLELSRLSGVPPLWSTDGRYLAVGVASSGGSDVVRIVEDDGRELHLLPGDFEAASETRQRPAGSGLALRRGGVWYAWPSMGVLPGRPVALSSHDVYTTPRGLVRADGAVVVAGEVTAESTAGSFLHDGAPGVFTQGDRRWVLDSADRPHLVPADRRILAIAPDGSICWSRGDRDFGVGERALVRVNDSFDGVVWGTVRRVGDDTLLLPPRHREGDREPTVIYLYPNVDTSMHAYCGPGPRLQLSLQPLARAGFAVYLPRLVTPPDVPVADGIRTAFRAAVKRAVETGCVDPGRIVTFGQSFGGYSVLVTATEPVVRAGVAISPIAELASNSAAQTGIVSDPEGYMKSTFGFDGTEVGQLHMHVPPWKDPSAYVAMSPFYQAGDVSVPLLLIGTTLDEEHARQAGMFFAALSRQGKPARLLVYPEEEHGVFRAPHVQDLWREVAAWYRRALGLPVEGAPGG